MTEPWVDQKRLAAHYGFTERWVRLRMAEGLPHVLFGRKPRYRLSETDEWFRSRETTEAP